MKETIEKWFKLYNVDGTYVCTLYGFTITLFADLDIDVLNHLTRNLPNVLIKLSSTRVTYNFTTIEGVLTK